MDFTLNLNLSGLREEHKTVPLDPTQTYDVLILGGGPAALTAAVYCIRKGVKTGLITKSVGGQVAETAAVENYMGFQYIEGLELVSKFRSQVKQFEIGYKEGMTVKAITTGNPKTVSLDNGTIYKSHTLIISTGKSPRRLNVPGEKELAGRGVAYCATCDAPLFTGMDVAVVGGGNSGCEAAIDLMRVARQVTLVQFLPELTADKIIIDKLMTFSNLKILLDHSVVSINGTEKVESVTIRHNKTTQESLLQVAGIFVEIGLIPNTVFTKNILKLNQWNEIVIDCACRTNVPGIFAAGDVTSVPYKQIIIAAGEGAKAALSACDFLLKNA